MVGGRVPSDWSGESGDGGFDSVHKGVVGVRYRTVTSAPNVDR